MKLAYYMLIILSMLIITSEESKATNKTEYELTDKSDKSASQTSLQDTVRAILNTHKDLKAIQENRQEAIHNLRAAKGGYGPKIDIVGNTGIRDFNESRLDRSGSGTGEVEVLLVQPIWDGFATRSRVRSSQFSLESTNYIVLDNATTLALDGVIAHIDLIWRKQSLKLAEDNVRAHERILAMTSDRQATGADTLSEVTQTKGRLMTVKSNHEAAIASLVQGENTYTRLTQNPVPKSLGTVKQPSEMFTNTEEILKTAKMHNPHVLSLLANIHTAQAEKELVLSANYPTINLEAGAGSGTYEPNGEWINSVGISATLNWNIYNSGIDRANTKAANAAIRESRQVANSYLDDLDLQIKNSWTDYQTAMRQFNFYEEAVKYNKQTLNLYLEQFNIGTRSLLDVLDAESELYNSRIQALTAKANVLVSSYTLYALAGTILPELKISSDEILIAPTE